MWWLVGLYFFSKIFAFSLACYIEDKKQKIAIKRLDNNGLTVIKEQNPISSNSRKTTISKIKHSGISYPHFTKYIAILQSAEKHAQAWKVR